MSDVTKESRLAGNTSEIKIDSGLYNDVYNRLGMFAIKNVADLGCGSGNFVNTMQEKQQRKEVYWGVDHDINMLEIARQRYPGWNFVFGDFFTERIQNEFVKFDSFLLVKILEFIEDDEKLLRSLPSGAPLVFTVPGFESPEHIRWFKDQNEIRRRYSPLISIKMTGRYRSPAGEIYYSNSAYRW